MYRLNLAAQPPAHFFGYFAYHRQTVQRRVFLYERHVVYVVVEAAAVGFVEPAEFITDG